MTVHNNKTMKNKRPGIILLVIALLLLIPFVAMRFTEEVDWTFSDFAVAAALLLATGLMGEFVMRKFTGTRSRIALCAALLLALLLVWMELAVGIFGTPVAGT